MRILHVVSGILGGAGRVAHELAAALAPRDASDVVLFSTATPDPDMVAALRRSCERVFVVTKAAKADPIAVARLALVLRRARPDVVLLHDFTAYVWMSLAARATSRVPLVAVEHSNSISTDLRRGVRRALHSGFAATICVSPVLESNLRAMGLSGHIDTIRNGIDQSRLAPLRTAPRFGASPLRLLMVGRLDLPKDHASLFQAMRLLADRGVAARLTVVGHGSLRAPLERQVHELGLEAAVRFEGAKNDLVPYYADADVVALSSRAEGLPLALIEGMAAGCLAIGSKVGAIGELLDEGRAGVLVPPGDASALAASISEIADAPDGARALARAGTERVEVAYSAARMAERYRAVLDGLMRQTWSAARSRA